EQQSGRTSQLGKTGVFFHDVIQQNNHKDEQHHDRAAIDNDLHGRNELRTHQQIESSERHHHHDQRKRTVNRMLLQNQVDCSDYGERGQDEENKQRRGHL